MWIICFGFFINYWEEVRTIKSKKFSYQDLQTLFEKKHRMPPESEYRQPDEIVYRCPYIPDCPGNYDCFVITAPEPLKEDLVLNVNCKLCRTKIPIYAEYARRMKKTK